MLIAGTSSDAGKSLIVTGLCRALHRRGVDVAPFKAQNMSNNSMVCADGTEIGRAQYLQAQAANVEASSLMNPVLLKPGTDRTSFVVLRGRPAGKLQAGEYANERTQLAEAAWQAYRELADQHDLVVCEGAGSPAEINLRNGDYTNMGLAEAVNLPVFLVGDIDRGGVLASLYGTWALLGDDDRSRLRGYIINKFRGDQSILDPGLEAITDRTGMANLGVLPWIHGAWLDGEDTLEVGRWRHDDRDEERSDAGGADSESGVLRVAVVRLPRISNATDVDALAHEPGVDVRVTQNAAMCYGADLVVLPGSRSTLSDLNWLRERGIADVIVSRHRRRQPVLGICGGFQMLGRRIEDGVESGDTGEGLKLLPHDVLFSPNKILGRPSGRWRGTSVSGYEIHHGVCSPYPGGNAERFLDGQRAVNTFGTMWHGAFECDAFRRAFLTEVADQTGCGWTPRSDAPNYADRRELMIDAFADAMERHVDIDQMMHEAT